MTVAKERLSERLGQLSAAEMRGVEMTIRIQLGLTA
jgi:mRNA-degrading endonuclease toxin of MazEF toxin-antitoxin module